MTDSDTPTLIDDDFDISSFDFSFVPEAEREVVKKDLLNPAWRGLHEESTFWQIGRDIFRNEDGYEVKWEWAVMTLSTPEGEDFSFRPEALFDGKDWFRYFRFKRGLTWDESSHIITRDELRTIMYVIEDACLAIECLARFELERYFWGEPHS